MNLYLISSQRGNSTCTTHPIVRICSRHCATNETISGNVFSDRFLLDRPFKKAPGDTPPAERAQYYFDLTDDQELLFQNPRTSYSAWAVFEALCRISYALDDNERRTACYEKVFTPQDEAFMGVMLLNIVTGGSKNSPGAIRTAMMSRKHRIDQARGNENVVRECTRSYKRFSESLQGQHGFAFVPTVRGEDDDEDEAVARSDTNVWGSQRRRSKLVAPPPPQEQGGDEQGSEEEGDGGEEGGEGQRGGQRRRSRSPSSSSSSVAADRRVRPRRGDDDQGSGGGERGDDDQGSGGGGEQGEDDEAEDYYANN